MPITLVVPKEMKAGEKRTPFLPTLMSKFKEMGVDIYLQNGLGESCLFADSRYEGANFIDQAEKLYAMGDVIFKVQAPELHEIDQMKEGAILISFLNPYNNKALVKKLRDKKITSFAMEMIPRISRAQSMDALSSQAAVAGYKAVLMAANESIKFFPMLTTAAGTIRPSKVLVLGAGVAGLQAIATAKRLGAIVEAYDVRPEVKEQVESLGGRYIEAAIKAQGTGGYARELTQEEKDQQKELLSSHVATADAVICTAGVPGKLAPKIITKDMIERMNPGSVVIDLVAESGGNCELTKAAEIIMHQGIKIIGPLNVPSSLAVHSSEMYAKNLFNLFQLMIKDKALNLDFNDEIIAQTAVTHAGNICNDRIKQITEEA